MSLKVANSVLQPYLPGTNELALHTEVIWGNIYKIYLHLLSFMNSEIMQVVEVEKNITNSHGQYHGC